MRSILASRFGKWTAAGLVLATCVPVFLDFHVLAEAQTVEHDLFSPPLTAERVVAASCGPGHAAHVERVATVVERPCPACLLARSFDRLTLTPVGAFEQPPATSLLPGSSEQLPSRRTVDLRDPRGPPFA